MLRHMTKQRWEGVCWTDRQLELDGWYSCDLRRRHEPDETNRADSQRHVHRQHNHGKLRTSRFRVNLYHHHPDEDVATPGTPPQLSGAVFTLYAWLSHDTELIKLAIRPNCMHTHERFLLHSVLWTVYSQPHLLAVDA